MLIEMKESVAGLWQDSKNFIGEQKRKIAGVAGGTAVGLSQAAGPDLTTLTAAVDFGTVTTAILGVGAAIIVVYIAWKGAKMVIGAVKGA